MSEKSIDGFEIHYPAPPPLVLDGKPLDKKINEASEKLAYGCNIYEVSPDGDDYILHSQFKLFHFRYKGGLASCSCNDFTYATGKPAAMCEHIAAFLKVSNNFSSRIKPLDAKPGLRGLIEKFCSVSSSVSSPRAQRRPGQNQRNKKKSRNLPLWPKRLNSKK